MAPPNSLTDILHASCIDDAGRGLLILGPSGAGKSGLALNLIALGARLVADDGVILHSDGARIIATCPGPLSGRIEARGIGLLNCPAVQATVLHLVVDLGQTETRRLPERHEIVLQGVPLPLVKGPSTAHFPASLLLYLREGRAD
jgi:HPr kinase/phosphorylase